MQNHPTEKAEGACAPSSGRDRTPGDLAGGPIGDLARHLGWTAGMTAHARVSAERRYGPECVVESGLPTDECLPESAVSLHCPAYPQPCSYVRAVQAGFEIGFWEVGEWTENPTGVVKAILDAFRKGSARA